MHAFKSAIERRQDLLCKENLLAGLWTIESRLGGMGGKYDPVFWWRVNSVSPEPLTLEFEVGEGLKLKKGLFTLAGLGVFSERINELFTPEVGWYTSNDAVMRTNCIFHHLVAGGCKGASKEIWLLGNEPEKYADLLCKLFGRTLPMKRSLSFFRK